MIQVREQGLVHRSAQEIVLDLVWPGAPLGSIVPSTNDLDTTLSSHPTRLKTSGSCMMFATPRKAGGLIKIATLFALSAVRIFFSSHRAKIFLIKNLSTKMLMIASD